MPNSGSRRGNGKRNKFPTRISEYQIRMAYDLLGALEESWRRHLSYGGSPDIRSEVGISVAPIKITPLMFRRLLRLVRLMAQGNDVMSRRRDPVLTTQEVAEVLGITRPSVISLFDSGDLRAHFCRSRRYVWYRDLMTYIEARDSCRRPGAEFDPRSSGP